MSNKPQDVFDMFDFIPEDGTVSMKEFTSGSSGSSRSSRHSSDEKEKLRPLANEIKEQSGLEVYYDRKKKQLRQKSPNADSEARAREFFANPLKRVDPTNFKTGKKSPDITQEDPNVIKRREEEAMINMSSRRIADRGWLQARMRSQTRKQRANKKFLDELPKGWEGGRKTRKKSKRFRNNNLRKNKISRKYIMLKQCGGGKAKMGAKSKPYSSKRKAMKSRRRVCYYKKKGRTLKLKKKAKKSRKRSRRRRRR